MLFTEDNLKKFARAYARTTYSQPLLLPVFLRGDALANALAVSDFLRWCADQHDPALTTHETLWPELLALCQKSNKADEDRDGGGSTSGGHDNTVPTSSTVDGVTSQNLDAEKATHDETTTDKHRDEENAKNVLEWVNDDDITEQLTLADALGVHESNNLETWLNQLRANRKKPLQCSTYSQAVALQKLITDYPNLAEAGRIVAGAVMLQAEKQLPVRLPRLLLQGEPGCGKTEFVRTIAETLSLPLIVITLSATCGEFELPGGHRTWRSATPGRLFQGLLKSPIANPLFLFDEAERGRKLAQSALFAWLEDAHFRDQFLDINFRADQVNSMLITNSLETLDAAIQSRCRLINVASLTNEEKRRIIPRIYARLLRQQEFIDFNSTMTDELIEQLLPLALRNVRLTLESALYNAALNERRELIVDDLNLLTETSRGFGFLRS